ncbi:MAG: valine--tRNA ligase [Chloroflexota bacterium]|nr:MAG: valine--tRNA ligase [Chloroflexota bacterium]
MALYSLPKAYDFKTTEQRIYSWWEDQEFFKPSNDPNKPGFDPEVRPFVISIPPPNVTGELHLGHAMFVSMEDLMIRYQRMKGVPSLWVPGTDHAGIATQLQVEKSLAKEGLSREQVGREEFLRRTWEWKDKFGGIITQQIRRLGASCDWERERFTLDEGLSRAVREAFVQLYEKGLIYRGPRLINWSPGLKTAVSDLEVEYSEEPGKLYYFKYMLAGSDTEFIPVATTRPETILGDTGLAVHPQDTRYQKFIGQRVIVPILGRQIPVIADEYVDREFGTGALKITPGHDPNDYLIGERHGLAVISVLDESARVNEHGGPYQGQDRFEARQNLWEDMRDAGLVIREEPYLMNIPRSQRGGEIIEPMISTQWFVRIQPLADAALEAVHDGRIHIIPDRFKKVYYNWLENIEDWCISRQLWWGHRIPVWTCQDCSEVIVSRDDPAECTQCGSANITQDPDVLDTWFSSGLWPFSTLGWPDETPDYKYFYPTSVMETGYDILFFWVARMIMDGIEFTGEVPFHTVYLHGLIRDEDGRKMSKTYGNVIDPLVVMDDLGTDALRFTLLVGSTPGNDTNLSLKKVEANRNFANKIWNAARFTLGTLEQVKEIDFPDQETEPVPSLADQWILARLSTLIRDVDRLFQNYQFGEAGRQVYDFFWNEFADWYVEIAKLQLREGEQMAFTTARNLVHVLDTCLRLLHPFTPFVTEEIWGHLKNAATMLKKPIHPVHNSSWEKALIVAQWPEPSSENPWEAQAVADFTLVMELVRSIRNLRAEKNVNPKQRIAAVLVGGEQTAVLEHQKTNIASLAWLDPAQTVIYENMGEKPDNHIALVVNQVEVYLPLAELVDPGEQRERLEKDLAEARAQIERLQALLASPFAEKAPPNVVEKERLKLQDYQDKAEKIQSQLAKLSSGNSG